MNYKNLIFIVALFVLIFFNIYNVIGKEVNSLLPYGSEVIIGNLRIQALSDSLVRIELKGPKGFEDRTTFHIIDRNWPGIPIKRTKTDNYEIIKTNTYSIKVPQEATSLEDIMIFDNNGLKLWSMPIETEKFLTNNRYWLPHPKENVKAWAIVDYPRIIPALWGYSVAPFGCENYYNNGWDLSNQAPDIYIFLPNGDGYKLRDDYLKLTGRSELIPLYAFGAWDSRYYPYYDVEALDKIDTYRTKSIPLDVFVVDTDWRVGASHGYQINTEYFPDMQWFLKTAHSKNVKIMFNDHPEPQSHILDPVEVEYRNRNLTNLFKIGLDIWWYDRNWSTHLISPIDINKEVFGMYIYQWITQDYYPNQRPLIMANTDGIDNGVLNRPPNIAAHRYTIQWTGDIFHDFDSLRNEIENAVYSGVYAPFAYTSSDLGGHNGDPTLQEYIRWVEYGALSPIFRLHCTRGTTRDPWAYGELAENVVKKFVQMRMRLLPIFYTAARENYDTGVPILRRCDLAYPNYKEAERNDQYLLGKDILVAPIFNQEGSKTVWIPEGKWINVWNGEYMVGPKEISVSMALEQMPIFVKSGSIITLLNNMQYTSEKPWDPVVLDIYPDFQGEFKNLLYEDDGITNDYKEGFFRTTYFNVAMNNRQLTLKINPKKGLFRGKLDKRSWVVRIHKPLDWNAFDVNSAIVDGAPVTFNKYLREEGVMPFTTQGSQSDSDIIQINIPSAPIDAQRTLLVNFL